MEENQKVIKAGVGYIVGNYLLRGLSFLTIPIFSRLMSTGDYGLFNTFIAYESILYIFIGLAIHSSYKNAKYKFEDSMSSAHEGYNEYISSSLVLVLLNCAILFLVVCLFYGSLIKLLNIDLLSLILLVVYSGGTSLIACFNSYVALEYKYISFIKVSVFNALSNVIVSILLMLTIFRGNTYVARIIGTTLPVIIISIYIIFYFWKIKRPGNYKRYWKWGISYSLPIIPHGVSQVVLSQFDRIMIASMISASSAGIYSFAYNIYAIVAVTATSLDNVWNPWFYEQMNKNNYDLIRKKSSIYAMMMALFSVGVILISPEVIKLLGSKDYWEAAYSVIPIVAGGYFAFLYNIPASVEYYYEKTKYIAVGTISAAVINIILNYYFINKVGYVAAAYTTLFTYSLYFIFHYCIAWKIFGGSLFSERNILFCSFFVIGASFVSRYLIDVAVARWLLGVIVGIAFVFVEEKELKFIYKLIEKIKRTK